MNWHRLIREIAGCIIVGIIAAYVWVYALDHWNTEASQPVTPPPVSGSLDAGTAMPPTSWPLDPEMIDVLSEGDDWDHPWEQCTINTDYWVSCPDGARIEYPAPLDDGAEVFEHAFDDASDLEPCEPGDEPTNLPCQVPTVRTDAVGGDGVVHDSCLIVLLDTESSELVCPDDTVWPS